MSSLLYICRTTDPTRVGPGEGGRQYSGAGLQRPQRARAGRRHV